MNSIAAHERLARDGFVRLENLLRPNQVKLLQQDAAALVEQAPQSWDQFVHFSEAGRWQHLLLGGDGRATNCFDFIGLSPALDQVLEDLFANADLRALLKRVLGTGYQMWYAQIRRAELGARSVRMHQDIRGEVGLSILLSPVPSAHGTTVFVPGSQRWPRVLGSFPFLSPRHVRRFIKGATGKPGDVYLFYNATWHGMATTDTEPRTAIILTFLPSAEGSRHRKPPKSVLDKVGPHLRKAMSGDDSESEAMGDPITNGSMGPDDVVAERLSPPPLVSLWRILILAAAVSDGILAVFRFLRRCLHRNRSHPASSSAQLGRRRIQQRR